MKRSKHTNGTRRTTVTLRAAALRKAEQLARERNVTLSTVIGDGLDILLHNHDSARQRQAAWKAYSQSLSGFSQDQLMVLDGIMLTPKKR